MREYAYEKAEALYNSVGAVQTYRTPPYPSTHNLGTNRMSAKAKDGVVDKWGRSHDIKNLFIGNMCLEYLTVDFLSPIPERIRKKFLQNFN